MSEPGPVYKLVEVVGTSKKSIEDAIHSGVTRTASTVRNIDWIEVGQIRGRIDKASGDIEYQVILKLGFRVE